MSMQMWKTYPENAIAVFFFRAVAKANFGKKILKINIDSEQCYFNLGPFV